jgi:hypothetical protein
VPFPRAFDCSRPSPSRADSNLKHATCWPQHRRRSEQADQATIVSPEPVGRCSLPRVVSVSDYKCASRLTTHQSQLRNHHFSNRPPRRLETTVTPRKQTAATRLNRQLSRIFGVTNHESQITNPGISNRHSKLLEFAATHTKQRMASGSNRHFLAGCRSLHPSNLRIR